MSDKQPKTPITITTRHTMWLGIGETFGVGDHDYVLKSVHGDGSAYVDGPNGHTLIHDLEDFINNGGDDD